MATQVGDEAAAQDLYGVGVRVGLYLQALGMMLSNHAEPTGRGKGLKLASGTITISILASWFVYAAQARFSPSEAICVLLILIGLLTPSSVTFLTPATIVGEAPGMLAFALTDLGISAALLWTFGRLVTSLPRLNTKNVVFFFAPVRLDGWFQYLALIFAIVDAVTSLLLARKIVKVMHVPWACYRSDKPEASTKQLEELKEIMDWEKSKVFMQCLSWVVLPLVVIAVETTLHWNKLSGSTDFQSPGQLIPLVTGILVLIDGLAGALRMVSLQAVLRLLLRKGARNRAQMTHIAHFQRALPSSRSQGDSSSSPTRSTSRGDMV